MTRKSYESFVNEVSNIQPVPYGIDSLNQATAFPAITILDAFSSDCFKPEFRMVPVSPADYRQAFDYYSPKLVLVESAWQGNDGHWTHQLVGSKGPRPQFLKFLSTARDYGIPIVFWNKEDPPHYEDFLPVARQADLVLTTAGELVNSYVSEVGHGNVSVLPFAAQPEIHHPFGSNKRDREICFAGQYFAHKYPERRLQMEYLFPSASLYDFSIFSRELGNDPNYAFPAPYDAFVQGSVPYSEMVALYRKFKIFLNVNSVVSSSTMCARRIFEITAAGGVVVSAPSAAISRFFNENEVFTPGDPDEAGAVFASLLEDEAKRAAAAHLSWRRTLSEHTYRHRVDTILALLGESRDVRQARRLILIDPRGSTDLSIHETVLQTRNLLRSDDYLKVVDFGDKSVRLSAEDRNLAVSASAIPNLQFEQVIVVSASGYFSDQAFGDLFLALHSYPNRGAIAKTAFNDRHRVDHRENMRLNSPPIWGAWRANTTDLEILNILETKSGVFNVLDYFNVLDRRQDGEGSRGWRI